MPFVLSTFHLLHKPPVLVASATGDVVMASVGSRESLLRPAYKVEELLALRGSVSESAVSLDKFGDEDAIKGA
jgi:hypothetical protein